MATVKDDAVDTLAARVAELELALERARQRLADLAGPAAEERPAPAARSGIAARRLSPLRPRGRAARR
jgi:hypothetical protein